MNDPGLNEPINEVSQQVEGEHSDDEGIARQEEQSYLNPSRWWFASTAFPLLAGTFGPMGTAFNVCALAIHWREQIPPGDDEEHGQYVEDPEWLIIVNAFSLAFALIANAALLLNMARRLSFTVAQPITIIGWYIASLLLIADLGTLPKFEKVPEQQRALTGAFYYAIFAAGLYFIISSLMVITVVGAWKGHYSREFKLTMSQRTLMLQTISFMVYLLGGAAVYAKIEGWQFLDAVYWADFTLLTVGIGDFAPETHLGRSLLFPFAIGGIVILGLVIGSIRSLVLERGKNKLSDRMTEKKREAVVKKIYQKGQTEKITPVLSHEQAEELGMSEKERRKQEFELMRKVQQQIKTRQKWIALSMSGGTWVLLWLVGAAVFYSAEFAQEWSYFDAVYFSYTSLLTIGYGDFKPQSNAGKAFFVFWSLLAIPTLTIVISNMGDTVVKLIRDATIYLGEFTVLPGEQGARARVKRVVKRVTPKTPKKEAISEDTPKEEAPGILGEENTEVGKTDLEQGRELHLYQGRGKAGTAIADKFFKGMEKHELEAVRTARTAGDLQAMDAHEYHYAVARELRKVLRHLSEEPPKKYTYDEWAFYLELMGENENSPHLHGTPGVKPGEVYDPEKHNKKHKKHHKGRKRNAKKAENANVPSNGADKGEENVIKPIIDEGSSSPERKEGDVHSSNPPSRQQGALINDWSWLGERNPLLGQQEEAEWVLEGLCVTLLRSLRRTHEEEGRRRRERNDKAEDEPDADDDNDIEDE